MGQVLSFGFLICLLCLFTTLLLHGSSSAQFGHSNKGGSLPEDGAVIMSDVENGKFSEVEGKNIDMNEEVDINGEGGEKKMHEMIDRGRELIFNIDYHGPTTHPPASPEKGPPGSGHH